MSFPAKFVLSCLAFSSLASFALTVEEVDIFGDPNPLPIYQIENSCEANHVCFKRDFFPAPENRKTWVTIKLQLDPQFKPVHVVENGAVNWTSPNLHARELVLPILQTYENYSIDQWATGSGDQLNNSVTGPVVEPGSTLFAARLSIDAKQWASTTRHFFVVGRILGDRIKVLGISDYEGMFDTFYVENKSVLIRTLKTMWKRNALPKEDDATLDKGMRRSGAVTVPYTRGE